jgi:hypothetical protein
MLALTALALAVASLVDDNSSALAPSDWQAIRAAHADARHAVEARGEAHTAFNHAQGLGIRFEDGCAHLEREGGGASVAFELERWGRADAFTPASDELAARAAGRRFERDFTGGLVEWWHNHDRGLEHGFTLAARPSGSGELFVDLALTTTLAPSIDTNARGLTLRDASGAVALTYSGLVAFDTDGDHLPARLELVGDVLRIAVDDAGADYPLTIDPIVQQTTLFASNAGAGDRFGWVVAITGNVAVVGAPDEDSLASGVNANLDNNANGESGAAYIFRKIGGVWTQEASLKSPYPEYSRSFGSSVAISGNTVAIGASFEGSNAVGVNGVPTGISSQSGAVVVYVHEGGTWSQQAYVKASNADKSDRFGVSVDVFDDRLVVGSYLEDSNAKGVGGAQGNDLNTSDSGAVYVFERIGTTWSQTAYIKSSNSDKGDLFGRVLALWGNRIVVGATSEDSAATGVDGDQNDNSALSAGAAYVFELNGASWTQTAYLKASNTEIGDVFSSDVGVWKDTIVVGACTEDSGSSGVDGDQSDNSEVGAGAAYVFEYDGSTWSQSAYLKAKNPKAAYQFGDDVAISGDRILIGSLNESSAAVGVDGLIDTNTSPQSGAAYLFERQGASWMAGSHLKDAAPAAGDGFGADVDISGDSVIVGAWRDSSAAIVWTGSAALFDLGFEVPPPTCVAPTPSLEQGFAELPVYFGGTAMFDAAALSDFGLCTITGVAVAYAAPKNGGGFHPFVPAALPPGAMHTPSLPVTGAPATTQFAWTPNANNQVGQWRFTYTLVDEFEQESTCSVVVEVRECLLLVGIAKADVDLGGGDRLLVEPFFVLPILSEAVPHLTVPNDPLFVGLDVYAQAVMWNPVAFPSNPLQMSNRLHYRIGVDVANDGNGSGLVIAPDPGAVHPGGVLKVTLGMAPN